MKGNCIFREEFIYPYITRCLGMVELVGIAYPAQSPYPCPVSNSWGVTLPNSAPVCIPMLPSVPWHELSSWLAGLCTSPYLHFGPVWMFWFPPWGRTDVFSYNLKDQPAQILLSQKLPGTYQEASPAGSQAYFSAPGSTFLTFFFPVLCSAKLLQCVWLFDPMDCSPPVSSVHGILQARILEWVAMPSCRGSSQSQGLNLHLLCLLHHQADSLPSAPLWKPFLSYSKRQSWATLLTASLTGGALLCLWQMEPGASFLIVLKGDTQPFSSEGLWCRSLCKHGKSCNLRKFTSVVVPGAQLWILFLRWLLEGTFCSCVSLEEDVSSAPPLLWSTPASKPSSVMLHVLKGSPVFQLLKSGLLNLCPAQEGLFVMFPLKSLSCLFLPGMNSSTFRSKTN